MRSAAFSLGANLGDRLGSLQCAVQILVDQLLTDAICSPVFETEPVGYKDQPAFFNCALTGFTSASPAEILQVIHFAELQIGRQIRPRWHEREIDIDLLLLGDLLIKQGDLLIPHPRMNERLFVLTPLAMIAPDMIYPGMELSIQQLLAQCPDKSALQIIHPPLIVINGK